MDKEELKARIHADYYYVRHNSKVDRFEAIRLQAKILATTVIDALPLGREMETALTKIEEACMHASAGIAREKLDGDR